MEDISQKMHVLQETCIVISNLYALYLLFKENDKNNNKKDNKNL